MRDYYELTKPGLVYGNLIPLIGGFAIGTQTLLSAHGMPQGILTALFAAVVGLLLIMASGCVFNNYIDSDIDSLMERTKKRALVAGRISKQHAFIFGVFLGVVGFAILIFLTNWLTVGVAAFGFFFYVFMYSLWSKRRTMYAVFVGAIAGAVPPVVGYTAASGRLDLGAYILFAMLLVWQLPHFFAIAIRRSEDYAAAGIPVLPGERGVYMTKIKMVILVFLFIIASAALGIFGYANQTYLVVVFLLGCTWFALALQGFWVEDTMRWARGMFLVSLVVLMVTFITIIFGVL